MAEDWLGVEAAVSASEGEDEVSGAGLGRPGSRRTQSSERSPVPGRPRRGAA